MLRRSRQADKCTEDVHQMLRRYEKQGLEHVSTNTKSSFIISSVLSILKMTDISTSSAWSTNSRHRYQKHVHEISPSLWYNRSLDALWLYTFFKSLLDKKARQTIRNLRVALGVTSKTECTVRRKCHIPQKTDTNNGHTLSTITGNWRCTSGTKTVRLRKPSFSLDKRPFVSFECCFCVWSGCLSVRMAVT